jgi:septal ring factor EnvC (AmiA/AmiB activator)
MDSKNTDITVSTILQHMQGMEERIMTKVDSLDRKVDRLERKVDGLEKKADLLEKKVDGLEQSVRGLHRNHLQTMTGLDNIDARLDDLEVVQVPMLRKAVGMK